MKLAIVGTTETATMANQLGPDWTVWTANGAWVHVRNGHKHFELHDFDYLDKLGAADRLANSRNKYVDYFDYIRDRKASAVIQNPDHRFPEATAFPLHKVLDKFPHRFLTSTPALMLALALTEHENELTDIAIFGIDMASADEYRDQRECFYYYMGYAAGHGIDVNLPPSCPLLTSSHIYAFEQPSAILLHVGKNLRFNQEEKDKAESLKINAIKKEQFHLGAIEMCRDIEKIIKR